MVRGGVVEPGHDVGSSTGLDVLPQYDRATMIAIISPIAVIFPWK
jgi:hypothetical protein